MIEHLSNHYAFTNPATIHDEEALTVLELIGRLGFKVHECVDAVNNFDIKLPQYVDKWLDEHPEVTTTLQDGEIEAVKLKNGIITKEKLHESIRNAIIYHTTPQLFGAVGDGVTDDTQAFKDAIEFLTINYLGEGIYEMDREALHGRCLYIPKGTYLIKDTIEIPSHINVIGEGKSTTILKGSMSNGDPIIKVTAGNLHAFYTCLSNLCIYGQEKNLTGLALEGVSRYSLNNVIISDCANYGIYGYESYLGEFISVYVRGCGRNSLKSVYMTGRNEQYGCHAVTFLGGEIGGLDVSGLTGLYLENGVSINLNGVTVEGFYSGTCIHIKNCKSVRCDNIYMEEFSEAYHIDTCYTPIVTGCSMTLSTNETKPFFRFSGANNGVSITENFLGGTPEKPYFHLTDENAKLNYSQIGRNVYPTSIPIFEPSFITMMSNYFNNLIGYNENMYVTHTEKSLFKQGVASPIFTVTDNAGTSGKGALTLEGDMLKLTKTTYTPESFLAQKYLKLNGPVSSGQIGGIYMKNDSHIYVMNGFGDEFCLTK